MLIFALCCFKVLPTIFPSRKLCVCCVLQPSGTDGTWHSKLNRRNLVLSRHTLPPPARKRPDRPWCVWRLSKGKETPQKSQGRFPLQLKMLSRLLLFIRLSVRVLLQMLGVERSQSGGTRRKEDQKGEQEGGEMANLASCCDLAGDERRTAADLSSQKENVPLTPRPFFSSPPRPFSLYYPSLQERFCGGKVVFLSIFCFHILTFSLSFNLLWNLKYI